MVHGCLETTFCGAGGGAALELSGLCPGTLQAQLQESQDGRERRGEERRERERVSEAVGYSTLQNINMNVMTYTQQRAELCGSSPVPAGIGACRDSYTTWAQHSPRGNPHRHQRHKSTYLHSHCRSPP